MKALYIVLRGGMEKVIRIRYTGDVENSPPVPSIKFIDRNYKYEVGEEFTFDGSGSSDPDGDALVFAWDFGDGTTSQERQPTHSFQETGKYQVTLIVTDAAGISQRTSLTLNIGRPPTVSITSPMEGEVFFVGQIFQLRGEAFNFNGQQLDDSSLAWEVRKHHADHFHPFLDLTHGNDLELFPAPEPEDFLAATNSYLEIILKATDGNGLTTTVNRLVQPLKINVGIESDPPDMELNVDAYPVTTSEQIVSWQNHKLTLKANDQPPFAFQSWWDGNTERERKITLEEDGQSILAIFCVLENEPCSSDEECCSGSCEATVCTSMVSSSNDGTLEGEGLESTSNDASDSEFKDKQDVGDLMVGSYNEDGVIDISEQTTKSRVASWLQDSWGANSNVFLTTIVCGANIVLLTAIVACLMGRQNRKTAQIDAEASDDGKISAGQSEGGETDSQSQGEESEQRSRDEEKGTSNMVVQAEDNGPSELLLQYQKIQKKMRENKMGAFEKFGQDNKQMQDKVTRPSEILPQDEEIGAPEKLPQRTKSGPSVTFSQEKKREPSDMLSGNTIVDDKSSSSFSVDENTKTSQSIPPKIPNSQKKKNDPPANIFDAAWTFFFKPEEIEVEL